MAAPNDEGQAFAAPSPQEQTKVPDADCAAKRAATLPALAALAGYELRRLADGRWLVSRWNLSKELDDSEVEPWLRQVGARSA